MQEELTDKETKFVEFMGSAKQKRTVIIILVISSIDFCYRLYSQNHERAQLDLVTIVVTLVMFVSFRKIKIIINKLAGSSKND